MTILLSIKPQFVQRIFSGFKRYEFRRAIFKQPVKKVVIYASAPVSMVVGEFTIEEVLHEDLDTLWKFTQEQAGISEQIFLSYFADKETGYAIKIGSFQQYDKPLSLQENFGVAPPQSFLI